MISPLLHVALFEPQIPGNAGNIARLCAATGTPLHLIGRLGFSFLHPEARRAGMDYWEHVELRRHVNFDDFLESMGDRRVWGFSTHALRLHWEADFQTEDCLLFGPESRGLPKDLLHRLGAHTLRIPMLTGSRSLNLATAVAIGTYEGLRRIGRFPPP